ncbi:MAG: choice-of-anchor D domain-containing protein [Bacteroidales bacterium]|jgi:hypothetical protein|nr:choice-of-anchor D domain-containing protein [Bacteroidales bacterium]
MKKIYTVLFFILFLANSMVGQILSENFNSVTPDQNINIIGWDNFAEKGTTFFQGKYDASEDNYFAQMSAYNSGEDSNFVWLVTPPVYLTPGNVLNFRSKSGNSNANVMSLWISTDYAGNIETANWTELTFTKPTDDGSSYGDWQNSGAIDLDAYTGSNVNFAFKYAGGDTISTVWQIDDIIIINKPIAVVSPASFTEELVAGTSITKSFTISNIGGLILSWDRDVKSFEKINYADWTLEKNQLELAENVLITRKNSQGIFNIAQEGVYNSSISPKGTLWAYGLTEELSSEEYQIWVDAVGWNPPAQVGENLSMKITDKDIYYDIVFKSWTDNANGGGFKLDYKPIFPNWLSVALESGETASGQSTTINVTFDATNLNAGTYYSMISFFTNDPLNPQIYIPVELTVNGVPEINVIPSTYNYNDVFINGTASLNLEIENLGTDTLNISSISSDETAFVSDLATFLVLPGESQIVEVSFNPTAAQVYNGILSIKSDDADEDSIAVSLTGQGISGPIIEVDSTSFNVSVTGCDQADNRSLKISNTGGNNLDWEISFGANVLALTYGVDMSTEYPNTIAAINQYFTDYNLTEINTTSATELENALVNNNILLIAEQEMGDPSVFTGFATVLQNFVNNGGKVIFCGTSNGDCIFNTGLFTGINNGSAMDVLTINDKLHPIVSGVIEPLIGQNATYLYDFTNSDAIQLVQYSGFDVVTYREINDGKIIYIGYDFFDYDDNAAKILANAIQWGGSVPGWLTISSISGTITTGNSEELNFEFNSEKLMEGNYEFKLNIQNNSIDNPSVIIPLTFTVNTVPIIELSATTIDFKNIVVDAQGNKALSVVNTGCDTLTITNITSSIPEFGFDVVPPLTILPDDTTVIRLSFNPTALATYNGILTITNNDTEKTVDLIGIGSEAPFITVLPDTFAVTATGCDIVQNFPVTIFNKTGLSNLNYSIVEDQDGSIVTLLEGSILPDDSLVYDLEIDATGLNSGLYPRELIINSNDTINPIVTIPYALIVDGNPEINLSLSSLDYGNILVNDDSTLLFKVKNYGCDTLFVTDITSSLPQFTADTTNFSILPGDSLNVNVLFIPTDVVTYNGVLTIVNNDAEQTINLTGVGIASATAEVVPDTLELIITGCDVIQNETITINNTGTAALNWGISTYQQEQIVTTMAAGNSQNGNMFDVYAKQSISIESFEINTTDPGNYTIEVYYKVGTYVGSETTAGDWTLFGTTTVIGLGTGNFTLVDFGKTLMIPGGETYGIYITTTDGGSINYTDGANNYSDDNISITTGVGKEYPFGSTFTPRTWNGRISYSIGVEWADFTPANGTIDSGNSANVNIEINTTDLVEGNYNGSFQINSNDPANPSINVPIILEIQGIPQIEISVDSINFGNVFKGDKKLQTISVINTGCDTLFVSDITNSILEFSIDNTTFEVLPKDTIELQVTFAPSAIEAYIDTLIFINDDEEIKIPVKGNGTGAPEITISPLSFDVTANGCDVVQILPLTIYNTAGLAELNYEIAESDDYNFVSNKNYTNTGENTIHTFSGLSTSTFEITLEITLNGDYTSLSEYADLYIDGDFIGRINETTFPDGTDFTRSFNFSGMQLEQWVADNEIVVVLDNSDEVNPGYGLDFNKVEFYGSSFKSFASGSVVPGGNKVEDIEFDATGLNSGVYLKDFKVFSNDPLNPSITVPYVLTVNGAPEISLSSTIIDFNEVYDGLTTTRILTVTNNGCDTLFVTDIVSDTLAYYPDVTSFELLPGESTDVVITFAPTVTGTIPGFLTITNNDEEKVVNLTGISITAGTPIIQINSNQLDFGDVYLGQISDEQEYIVSGSGLTENISISVPYGFQISTSSGAGFTNTLSLNQIGGDVSATTIYVRFIPTAKKVYNESIIHISAGATQRIISVTGEGVVPAEINTSKQKLVFEDVYNGFESTEQSYTVSADGLSQNLVVTAPNGFVISKTTGSGFTNVLNFEPASGIISTSNVYVKFAPNSLVAYDENIVHTSTDATSINVNVTGTSLENYLVTFNVNDGANPIDGAIISIDGHDITTAAGGIASINLLVGDYNFSVTSTGYDNYSGTVSVVDQDVTQNVVLILTTYDVQFVVTSAGNPLIGATVALTGYGSQLTNASGLAVFTDVAPASSIAYSVTLTGYTNATGNVTVVNANVTQNVSMSLSTSVDEEIGDQIKVEVFPNPFTNSISIKSTIGINQFVITNVIGQKVLEIELNGSVSETIQTSDLSNGIYFITATTSDENIIKMKMVKE